MVGRTLSPLLVLLLCSTSHAAEHYATDLTPAAIQAAVDGAAAGDAVVLPAGHNSTDWQHDDTGWYAGVTVPAGVSIRGQGSDQTVLEQVDEGGTWPAYRFFYFNPQRESTTHTVELAGVKLIGATTQGAGIAVEFRDLSIYVHDVDISYKNYGIKLHNSTGVVADSSFFYMINDESPATHGSGGYGVSVSNDADISFTFPWKEMGTGDAVFVEDCYFYACKHGVATHGDSNTVVRYNTFERGWAAHGHIDSHGSRDGEHVGSNVYEVYRNDVHINCQTEIRDEGQFQYGILMRGGSGVFWGNTFHSGDESGANNAMLIADMDIDTSTYDVASDYPLLWQPRNIWAWDNTIDGGEPVDATSHGSEWIVEDRLTDGYYDFRNAPLEGYTSYPYPHPMRGLPEACEGGVTRPCYSAAPDTRGVGTCQDGAQECVDGTWGACVGEVTPSSESCSGVDEDCDGIVDEDCPGRPPEETDERATGDDADTGCGCHLRSVSHGSLATLLLAMLTLAAGVVRSRRSP